MIKARGAVKAHIASAGSPTIKAGASPLQAFFTVTLPDPTWPKEEQDDFMSQWYGESISNVSVHEVWPGHYVQFLYAKDYPSDVRKVFPTASNFEARTTRQRWATRTR